METPQVKQPVRWQSDNVESGRPIRDNMDVEGVTLEWNTGSYGDESQKAQKKLGVQLLRKNRDA
jgi:hypothetical protein